MIARTHEVMGTVVSYLIDDQGLTHEQIEGAIADACREFTDLDARFSTWKPESELSQLRRGGQSSPSALMEEVIDLCGENFELTRGFFDPWAMPGGFDPTGLVKGWAAERALRVLAEHGVINALVNAGGDVCVTPGASFLVGIQHPFEAEALCGVVNVTSAVATSGIYARGAHLINPHGESIAAVSATVVGGRLVVADALATALAVGGASVLYLLEEIEGVEGFFITPEGVMFTSSGMAFAEEGATASTLDLATP
ncbi:MAG: hypothetical protein B7X07_01095 [Actinobacteria bacterium 21-64-8]|nr:MAG: hypothetical protein B7X07_01095 [Actinobacteria bacterium 21-64-8]